MSKLAAAALGLWLSGGVAFAQTGCRDIGAKICTLANDYQPFPGPGRDHEYVPPRCDRMGPSASEKRILQKAFEIAPRHIKEELCALKHVFVLDDGTHSWGKWEDPRYHSPPNGSTYVGILTRDLKPPLAASEDSQLHMLGIKGRARHAQRPDGTASRTLAVLATLSHVIGHVKWRRDKLPETLPCIKTDFEARSWPDPGDAYTRRWTTFGDTVGTNRLGLIPHGASAGDLRRIYGEGFVTAVAAASLEEDFAETYKIVALERSRQLGELTIHLGQRLKVNDPRRGISETGDDILGGKWACAAQLFDAGGPETNNR